METLLELDKAKDEEIIKELSRVTGVEYSEEQKNILMHRGGMCILASAGSGKTTILTHLIAKRIKSHEIQDVSRLLCTTYSRAGAIEMEQRLKKLFRQVGINKEVNVKTMHALYLGVLKYFGYPSTVIEPKDRVIFLKQAIKDADVFLDEEEFQTLDSLLSYQINNLMNDTDLIRSYAYTLDNVPLEKYSAIRQGYNLRKLNAKVVDFDDMQLYVYSLMYMQNRQDIIDYCRNSWGDIYVDEAQDMSRIQYAILKKIITDPNKLVVIGDDDQCLVGDTEIEVEGQGTKKIKDIVPGDKVLTATGNGTYGYREVDRVSSKDIDSDIVTIKLENGCKIQGTPEHVGFAISANAFDIGAMANEPKKMVVLNPKIKSDTNIVSLMFFGDGSIDKEQNTHKLSIVRRDLSTLGKGEDEPDGFKDRVYTSVDQLLQYRNKLDAKYKVMYSGHNIDTNWFLSGRELPFLEKRLCDIQKIDYMPVVKDGEIVESRVVDVSTSRYTGKVYDISVPDTRNFIANGVVVHNCIYQWRGADPSIILNICADYDITRFVLSTNYRCAGEIVKLANVGIKHNSVRSDKDMNPYREGGEIKICDCGSSNLYTMSKYAYKHIKDLVLNKGVKQDQIAVLSRNNAHLCILSNMLFKDGIHCEATTEMKLTKSLNYREVKDVLELAMNSYNSNITASALNNVTVFLNKANAKRFGTLQSSLGLKLSDTIGYMAVKFWRRRDVNWTGNVKVPALAEMNLAQTLSMLDRQTIENLVLVYKLLTDNDLVKRATGLLTLYLTATEFKYRDKPDRKRAVEGLVDYISDLIRTMGYNDTKSYLKVSEQYEEGRMAVPGQKVCMSTMHGAKGKEWDNVILFADDNITFPSFGGIVTQLKSGVATSDIYYGIDENRRLHYVAMTRARKELAIFTDRKNVGLYLLEALSIFDYGLQNNAHIISMSSNGEIYKDILAKSDTEIFDEKSRYNYKIDISDLCATVEIDYLYRGTENKNTVSIDDIMTASPQIMSD